MVDLRDHPLPFFDGIPRPGPAGVPNDAVAARRQSTPPTASWCGGRVQPRLPSGAQERARLDVREWHRKPVAFVGWGNVGGARAIEQLRGGDRRARDGAHRFAVHVLPATMIAVRSVEDTERPPTRRCLPTWSRGWTCSSRTSPGGPSRSRQAAPPALRATYAEGSRPICRPRAMTARAGRPYRGLVSTPPVSPAGRGGPPAQDGGPAGTGRRGSAPVAGGRGAGRSRSCCSSCSSASPTWPPGTAPARRWTWPAQPCSRSRPSRPRGRGASRCPSSWSPCWRPRPTCGLSEPGGPVVFGALIATVVASVRGHRIWVVEPCSPLASLLSALATYQDTAHRPSAGSLTAGSCSPPAPA